MPPKGTQQRATTRPILVKEPRRLADTQDEGSDALNFEFQALVETLFSIYINSWYSYITPREQTFLPHINGLVFATARSITSQIDPEDFLHLVLIRLPTILAHHVELYHLAQARATSSLVQQPHDTADSPAAAVATAYHSLANHLGIVATSQPDRPYAVSPVYLGILTRQLLKAHLPSKDAQSELEMSLMQDIIAKAVLENTLSKLAEPWFIWTVALVMLEDVSAPARARPSAETGVEAYRSTVSRYSALLWTLMVALLSAVRSMYTAWTAPVSPEKPGQWQHVLDPWMMLGEALLRPTNGHALASASWSATRTATGLAGPAIDEAIPALVRKHALRPDIYATAVRKLHTTVFPNGQMAPTTAPPSAAETILLRKRLERAIMLRVPPAARWFLLGRFEAEQRRRVADVLDPFANPAINAHLAIVLVDSLVGLVLKPVL